MPLIDFHVHLDRGLTLQRALELSAERSVQFGIVEHGGRGHPIANDNDLLDYLGSLEGHPVYRGMQAEGRDWMQIFSADVVRRLDYVLTDALTFPYGVGEPLQLWLPDACADLSSGEHQHFVERYVEFHVQIIADEPIDILANPTFLPACMADEYEALWTKGRMVRIIQAAADKGVALEINSRYRVPSPTFIGLAKEAGVRFSFGSNYHSEDVGKLGYCIEVGRLHNLTEEDLFSPDTTDRS